MSVRATSPSHTPSFRLATASWGVAAGLATAWGLRVTPLTLNPPEVEFLVQGGDGFGHEVQ